LVAANRASTGWKIQKLKKSGGLEYAKCSGVANFAEIRFRATRGVVHDQEGFGLLLGQQNCCALAGIDLVQGRVDASVAKRSYCQPIGRCLNPLRDLGRCSAVGEFGEDLRKHHDHAVQAMQYFDLTD
jgi:hypothetical protein